VEKLLGVALVDVEVAEAGGAEETAVRDGAAREVDGDRGDRGAQRHPHAMAPVSAEAAARVEAEEAAPEAEAGAAPEVAGGEAQSSSRSSSGWSA